MGRTATVGLIGIRAVVAVSVAAAHRSERPAILPLTVVATPTPKFNVPRYVTSGTYPQVRRSGIDLRNVNAALRAGIVADQRRFAPYARRGAIGTSRRYHGIYSTTIDPHLLSASSVVVSALLPAIEQYPGGSLGRQWVAVTVQVRSARLVQITELFANPSRGLRVLGSAWERQFRREHPKAWPCVTKDPPAHRPIARNYQYFALTPRGLAVGFWQEETCDRLNATVPYRVLRPYLSTLGSQLVAGVRAPR